MGKVKVASNVTSMFFDIMNSVLNKHSSFKSALDDYVVYFNEWFSTFNLTSNVFNMWILVWPWNLNLAVILGLNHHSIQPFCMLNLITKCGFHIKWTQIAWKEKVVCATQKEVLWVGEQEFVKRLIGDA